MVGGQGGDLAAAQAGDAALAELRHAGLFGGELGPSRGEKVADLGTVVHDADPRTGGAGQRCPVSTPINSDFPSISAEIA